MRPGGKLGAPLPHRHSISYVHCASTKRINRDRIAALCELWHGLSALRLLRGSPCAGQQPVRLSNQHVRRSHAAPCEPVAVYAHAVWAQVCTPFLAAHQLAFCLSGCFSLGHTACLPAELSALTRARAALCAFRTWYLAHIHLVT